jgi:hypothetical protein
MGSNKARVDQNPRLALFTAFFCLARNTPYTPAWDYFEAICRFLYDLSFPCAIYVPNSAIFPMEWSYFFRQLWTHDTDKYTTEMVTAYVVAFMVTANVAYLCYLVYFYTDKRSTSLPPSFMTKVMHEHIMWSTGPLVIPYTSIMLQYISCEQRSDIEKCQVIAVDNAQFAFFLHNGGYS